MVSFFNSCAVAYLNLGLVYNAVGLKAEAEKVAYLSLFSVSFEFL